MENSLHTAVRETLEFLRKHYGQTSEESLHYLAECRPQKYREVAAAKLHITRLEQALADSAEQEQVLHWYTGVPNTPMPTEDAMRRWLAKKRSEGGGGIPLDP